MKLTKHSSHHDVGTVIRFSRRRSTSSNSTSQSLNDKGDDITGDEDQGVGERMNEEIFDSIIGDEERRKQEGRVGISEDQGCEAGEG